MKVQCPCMSQWGRTHVEVLSRCADCLTFQKRKHILKPSGKPIWSGLEWERLAVVVQQLLLLKQGRMPQNRLFSGH